MDLQTEYTRRHKINTVVGVPDSFLFFRDKDRLYAVTIAHRPRTAARCEHCGNGLMSVEAWIIDSFGASFVSHDHIGPDEDILSKLKTICPNMEVIRYTGEKDLIDLIWKAMGNKGKNTREEMYQSAFIDNSNAILSATIGAITYRKHPLLFDALRGT